jgi:hypothetical protein
MAFKDHLKSAFSLFKNKTRLSLILALLLIFGIVYSRYIKALVFVVIFIALGGISKIYHRFFKSSIGIDLVFFFTLVTSLTYKNLFFSLSVAWLGLIIADSVALKFSYTSLISFVGLTIVALLARILPFGILFNAIIILIIFEIYSIAAYNLLGSSADKIMLYLISHSVFNAFLIVSFLEILSRVMI